MSIREDAFSGKPIKCRIIDSHTHIKPVNGIGLYQGITTESEIVDLMDKLGIDCIVTAPHPILAGMMSCANKQAKEAIDNYPGRIYGYISICPHDGIDAIKKELELYKNNSGFLGLKILSGYHGELDRKEFLYALDFADEMKCPVVFHKWTNSPGIESVRNVLETHRNLKLICAHLGGGSSECFYELNNLIKTYPNLFTDICGSVFNSLDMETVVETSGDDRIIYGSDLIYLDPRYDLGKIIFSTLSDDVKEKLLSSNYLSLLKDSQMGKIVF